MRLECARIAFCYEGGRVSLMGLIAIYGLPSRLYSDFDLNQCLAHSASMKHASDKAMMLLGLMWMVARWACYGFVQKVLWLVAARWRGNGLFCCLGCGVSGQYKKRVHVCVCLETLTPCKGAFEKTTPCKV